MSNNLRTNKPTVHELDLELKRLTCWQRFGIHLPKIEECDVKVIEQDNQGSIEKQKLALFGTWLRRCTNASWLDVISTLENIEEYTLAEHIKLKYSPVSSLLLFSTRSDHHIHSPNSSYRYSRLPTRSYHHSRLPTRSEYRSCSPSRFEYRSRSPIRLRTSHSPARLRHGHSPTCQQSVITVDQNVVQKLKMLNGSFAKLARKIQIEMEHLVLSDKYLLHTLAIEIRNAYCIKDLNDVKTTDEFFVIVDEHYSFLDCDLVVTIVESLQKKELLDEIQGHVEAIRAFKRNASVKSLQNNLEKLLTKYGCSNLEVTIKLEDEWGKLAISVVEQLLKILFPGDYHECKWYNIVPGSFCVSFLVPENISKSLITSSNQKLQFMQLVGVFGLTIGNTPILETHENENFTFDSALLESSQSGDNEAVQFLLDLRVNINYSNSDGKTAIMLADEAGHKEVVQTLISAGANHQDSAGETALMLPDEAEYKEVVETELPGEGIESATRQTTESLPIGLEHKKVIQRLLAGSANVNRDDTIRQTKLMFRNDTGLDSRIIKLPKKEMETRLEHLVHWASCLPGLKPVSDPEDKLNYGNKYNIVNQSLPLFWTRLHSYPDASSDDVKLKFEEVDLHFLAKQIKDRPANSRESSDSMFEELTALHTTFIKLVNDFHIAIDKLAELPENAHLLQELISFLKDLQQYEIEELNNVQTTDELIDEILHHCNFLSCDLLQQIVEEYVKELLPRTQSYIRKINDFKCSTPIKSLRRAFEGSVGELMRCIIIIIKLHKVWEEIDMVYLEKLVLSLFPGYNPKWFAVRSGSLCCAFLTPKSKAKSYITSSSEKLQFMRLTGIFGLQIGITHVIRDDKNESFTFDSALLEASQSGNNEAVQFLIDLLVNKSNAIERQTLKLASEARHAEVVQALISARTNINHQNSAEETVLMIACEKESLAFIHSLLSAKADPDLQNGDGDTVMHLACSGGNRELVNLLVKFDANPIIANSKDETAFMISITNNSLDIVTDLIHLIPSTHIESGLITSFRLGYPAISSLLVRHLHISLQMLDFFIASLSEDITLLKQQLTQSDINPNVTLISNITPLMIASSCGHTETLECLLHAEAAVNSKDKDGYTPLAYAITGSKSLTAVQQLLESGANPNVLLGGIFIIEKAKEENGTEEIVNLLLKYLALRLHNDHEQLVQNILQSINEQIEEEKITLKQVAEKMEADFVVTGLTKSQNIHALFNNLQPYYSFLSCDILVDITREFIGGEIENELEGYLVMMTKFQKSVKIKQLKEVMSLVPIQDDTSDTCDVDIQLNGEWEEGTLENLQQLRKHMFHNRQHLLKHMTVERESLCITFIIPTSQCDGVVNEVKRSKQFIECVGVSRVSVGDVEVVNRTEDTGFNFSSGFLRAAENCINEAVQFLLNMGVNIDNSDCEGRTALILASKAGHQEIVQAILSAGSKVYHQDSVGERAPMMARTTNISSPTHSNFNPDIQDNNGMTALSYASLNGNLQVVETLLNGGADGLTALISASQNGHSEVVQILLKGGADPNIQKNDGATALMSASQNGHSEVVHILLKRGADSNIQRKDGVTALMIASYNGHSEVINILINGGGNLNVQMRDNGWTALKIASQNGNCKVVQILLKGGADPNIQMEHGATSLVVASENGHSEVVQILLKGGADPNIRKEDGATALMSASQNGHSEVVHILLKRGADSNIQRKDGVTALMIASYNGHSEAVEILLKGGSDPSIKDEKGGTPLVLASQNGHSQVVEILLKGGADPNIQMKDGETALLFASHNGHSKVVEILLKGGSDPNIRNEKRATALISASLNGHSEVIQILLKGGADPNVQEQGGWTALISASMNGHSEAVEILLKGGSDPSIMDEKRRTALVLASQNGHAQVVEILLKREADPNIQMKGGVTALLFASHNGHSQVIQILLNGGADPNIQKQDGWTSLMSASMNCHSEAVEILLKGGADPNIQMKDGATALMSTSLNGYSGVVQILLKGGADPNIQEGDGWTALMSASENGHSEVIQILLKGSADPNIQKEDGWTALMSASMNGHSEAVEILLKGGSDPSISDERGGTALVLASQNGHSQVVEILLEGRADPNIEMKDGVTALVFASHSGHSEVIQILLKASADPNIQNKDGWTALMSAGMNGCSEAVEILLKGGSDPNIRDQKGRTALMSASMNGHSEAVEILLKGGADINIQKKSGATALMLASMKGHSQVVDILLKGGSDPNIRDEKGGTALVLASQNGHSQVVEILLKGGADPMKDGVTALVFASHNGHSKVVEILLKRGGSDPNIRDKKRVTALVLASLNGYSSVVQILLKGGADPNIQEKDGWTALMSASLNGHSEAVEILLKGGADPNIQMKDGETALVFASHYSHSKVVEILLKGGADPNIQMKDGATALVFSSHNGHSKVVEILLKGGSDPNIGDEKGRTALMSASMNGHSEAVEILLKGGSDPNIRDEKGRTALMSASMNGHSEAVEILLKGGADINIQKKSGATALMFSSLKGH